MPEFPLRDTIVTSLNAQEPWPDNVKLFQPYEVEQILLPDNASCLAVQAFLKMCNLPFEVEMRWNAEFMSPSGRVPFIKCGAFVVSELEPIVQFAANKGVSLCTRLSTEEKAEMRAYMSLITNVLVNAELYISWIDNETFNTVTKVRNSSVYPWPLGWLQTRSKRNSIAKRLKALSWHDKTLEQVLSDVEQCCNSLSQRLGERDYFFGTPTPLDALIFGHMRALLSANGPKAVLMIKPITSSLLKHTTRMSKLTEMPLKEQEQYLISQAFQICNRRRINVDPSERGRAKKSKLGLKTISRDSFSSDCKDVFGFKPFASKKVIIMTTKEGILCDFDETRNKFVLEEDIMYIEEVLDEIIDKVDECAKEPMVANLKNNVKLKDCLTNEFNEKFDRDNEKNDFEVIEFSRSKYDKNDSPVSDVKLNYLDTIDENDLSDSTASLADPEDVIQIINDDGRDIIIDSDGIVNDNLLSSPEVFKVLSKNLLHKYGEDVNDPSIKKQISESHINIKSSGDMSEVTAKLSKTSAKSLTPSGSKTLMKFPSNEQITVEKLLNYLRKKNAAYKDCDVPDID